MTTTRFNAIREIASAAFWQHLPDRRDTTWLAEVVDPPRFGWDWEALEQGFLTPLRSWAIRHDARLRPALAGLLIDALGGDAARHGDVFAALELNYQSAIMLDDLRNGRDLTSSTVAAVSVPLPVWVTIAYNGRQLAPVLIMRRVTSLNDPARVRLAHRFGRFLFQQGVGSTLDLQAAENAPPMASIDQFINHLSLYIGNLSFGLACDCASVTLGLGDTASAALALAGTELGVALRLKELAQGRNRELRLADKPVIEQLIRWQPAIAAAELAAAGERLRQTAFARAKQVDPAAEAAFASFVHALQGNPHGENPV